MKKIFLSLSLILTIFLSGCITDHERCQDMGAYQGTPQYYDCRMTLQQQRANAARARQYSQQRNYYNNNPAPPCDNIWCQNPSAGNPYADAMNYQ